MDAQVDHDDEVEFSHVPCPSCNERLTLTRTCWACGGAAFHDMHDEDPLRFNEGDVEPCEVCAGQGAQHWCGSCGWDFRLKRRTGAETDAENVQA